MSYILDALRKSEQQRQALKPDTVTDRVLINQAAPQNRRRIWLWLLLLGNLIALGGAIWFFGAKSLTLPQSASSTKQVPSDSHRVPELAVGQSAGSSAVAVPPMPDDTNQEPVATSIADMMVESVPTDKAGEHVIKGVNIEKKTVPQKKQLTQKPARIRPPVMSADAQYQQRITSINKRRARDLAESSDNQPESRPKLTINVFSYAPHPQDRFVMINMTKYKVGQLISDGVKLKEIHPNHIVLQQGGTTFKMDRP